jgi:D-sedoheptulose 7-phosphate isomerase
MSADLARERMRASVEVHSALLDLADDVAALSDAVVASYRAGGKLLLFGNGGSAADAQHIASEFVGRFELERDSLPAIALSVNTSAVTAIANDYGYERVFERQLRGLGSAGDVAVGISTSGGSANVLNALRAARSMGMTTVGLTGASGGAGGGDMPSLCDHCIVVPSDDTPRIQEAHILVAHVMCELVERALFPG